jgi:hypothetical protein
MEEALHFLFKAELIDLDDAALDEEVHRLRSCIAVLSDFIGSQPVNQRHEIESSGDGKGPLASDLAIEIDPSEWQVPPHCIPIHANVTTYVSKWKSYYYLCKYTSIHLLYLTILAPQSPNLLLCLLQLLLDLQLLPVLLIGCPQLC